MGRKYAEYSVCRKVFMCCYLVQKAVGVVVQAAGFGAFFAVAENVRIAAFYAPFDKKERPVYVFSQFF